ncbi:hypothetical protein SDC9_178987 [bioreactor metagenome]|uniref:Uncharacterized protein n=1 Tax=bioreactor metagenome TaxID=1076179 RepID=A0A645H6R4_9ZZZZ
MADGVGNAETDQIDGDQRYNGQVINNQSKGVVVSVEQVHAVQDTNGCCKNRHYRDQGKIIHQECNFDLKV